MTLLSIITINYNNYLGLAETIKSVELIKDSEFEFIVIDGMSNDDSVNLILGTSFITNYIIEPDQGIYDAMNKGANISCGKYLYFLNSGDRITSNFNKIFKQLLLKYDYDVIYGNTLHLGSNFIDYSRDIGVISYEMPFCHQSVLVLREQFNRYLYDKQYKYAADYKFFLELYLDGASFLKSHHILGEIDTTGVSHSRQLDVLKEYLDIIWASNKFFNRYLSLGLFFLKKSRFILVLIFKKYFG